MKEIFDPKLRLNNANKIKLVFINKIINEYKSDGYILTLRQLYYQLVSRDVIPNLTSEYGKLGNLLKKGRMAGVVDWDAIEDRLRKPILPYYVDDVPGAIDDTINQYRLDRMKDQDVYIEVWSEKDALSGILYRVTNKYHVRLIINRGYGSITAIYDAYKRFKKQIVSGKKTHLLYFGDHDASGLDMVRDVEDRMLRFFMSGLYEIVKDVMENRKSNKNKIEYFGNFLASCFRVHHIGLTTEQVKEFNPPPNPAKESDPRFQWYLKRYGDTSWEVDALEPKLLSSLLSNSIESFIDIDKFNDLIDREKEDKKHLENFRDKL